MKDKFKFVNKLNMLCKDFPNLAINCGCVPPEPGKHVKNWCFVPESPKLQND